MAEVGLGLSVVAALPLGEKHRGGDRYQDPDDAQDRRKLEESESALAVVPTVRVTSTNDVLLHEQR